MTPDSNNPRRPQRPQSDHQVPPSYPPRQPRYVTRRPSSPHASQQPSNPRQAGAPRQSGSAPRQSGSNPAPSYPPRRPRQPLENTPRTQQPRTSANPRPSATPRPAGYPPQRATQRPAVASNPPTARTSTKRKHTGRNIAIGLVLLLILLIAIPIAWVSHLYSYGSKQLAHSEALSTAIDTPGTTYLIVGSDERVDADFGAVEGMRSDSIMILQKAENGKAALVSIPRDSFVTIPEWGDNKVNAAFAFGGPQLLVQTVENLTGLTIDHYVQVGMHGVEQLTDAVGGVELCLDYDVSDYDSGLEWTAGCHLADGKTALAFSRMRNFDPLGDIGRTARQRQVVSAILDKAISKSVLLSPTKQKELVGAAASVLSVDESDSLMDVGWAGLALRDALSKDGLIGAPPIASLGYDVWGVGSVVLLDPDTIDSFWQKFADGTLTEADFYNPLG